MLDLRSIQQAFHGQNSSDAKQLLELSNSGYEVHSPYGRNIRTRDGALISPLRASEYLSGTDDTGVSGPYPTHIIRKSNQPELPSILLGSADRLREQMEREREGKWSIDAQLVLTAKERRRMFGYCLFTPHAAPVDLGSVKTVMELDELNQSRSRMSSNFVHSKRACLEESDWLVHGKKDHPLLSYDRADRFKYKDWYQRVGITVDGALRMLDDACKHADDKHGVVGPNPLIRVVCFDAVGMIFTKTDLDVPETRNLLASWLWEMVEASKGDGRFRYYDPKKRKMVFDTERHRIASSDQTMRQIFDRQGDVIRLRRPQ